MRGAAQGEGLGNQFLANIRDCDAIALVARCFEDGDVTHVEGRVDPLADLDIIETELMIADLESLEKRVSGLEKRAKQGEKESVQALALVKLALTELIRRPTSSNGQGRRGRRQGVADAAAPDHQAGALRLQRR